MRFAGEFAKLPEVSWKCYILVGYKAVLPKCNKKSCFKSKMH